MIQQLTGILQDTESIRLDGATSADLLEDILSGVSTLPSSSDVSAIRTATESIYRLENSHLGYLSSLPDIEDFNYQQIRLLRAITNLLHRGGGDELAGNPWWTTNSTFTFVTGQGIVTPPDQDGNYNAVNFPYFMSTWSRSLTRGMGNSASVSAAQRARDWWKYYGATAQLPLGSTVKTYTPNQAYTWFDWMSDATRSNWVLHASMALTSDAPDSDITAVTSAVDDGGTDGINGVPEMVIDQMDVTGVEAGIELVDAQSVGDILPASFTGGDPGFLVFSGGRYGDVTVPEVRGSLAIPDGVASYLRGVATWLWRVALFVGCFVILRQEVAFWSTLGGSASDA